jgi:hypothetical protein
MSIFDHNISLYVLIYAGYTLFGSKRDEEILEELKVKPVDETIRRYKAIWLPHVIRMKCNRVHKNNIEL